MDIESLRSEVNKLAWFHHIDFGHGIISPGKGPVGSHRYVSDIYFKRGIVGQTFLDIGCWDGFNSFEAHRRGAARVLATDHFVWHHHSWASRACFDLAHANIAPSVEVMDIDAMDLMPDHVGRFDVVLFAGVLYHLRHPFLGLERAAALASSTLIVETWLDARDQDRPMMVFYPGQELAGDSSNWWGPNRACVEGMLRDLGFTTIEYTARRDYPDRGIFHAIR